MKGGAHMKALLLYPNYPDTFWSFKHALKFISKKAVHPPLGLLTIASMLPDEWEKRLRDMNVEALEDRDLEWADYVFISAMAIQKESIQEISVEQGEMRSDIKNIDKTMERIESKLDKLIDSNHN